MSGLLRANVALAILATLAPAAHVLELPNKMMLDGLLWLAVQQHLYRGWGPFLGAPTEIGALASALALLLLNRSNREMARMMVVEILSYCGMLAAFFSLNAPVNAAVSVWTSADVPDDWPSYRLRWEAGHALAATLSVIAAIAAIKNFARECRRERCQEKRSE